MQMRSRPINKLRTLASDVRSGSGIRAAEYLRVSHSEHRESLKLQAKRIRDYAERNGFLIIKTFMDCGKSGLVLRERPGLKALLDDVLSKRSIFKAILVDDLSRWGRFQDADESAHYEFVCKQAGIPVHYCNETFQTGDTPLSGMLKNVQRAIAAEYSRELSQRCFDGAKNLVEHGFRAGGQAGYGFGGMAISSGGSKYVLNSGEYKVQATDRVILILGPIEEVECVKRVFRLALNPKESCEGIAKKLNNGQVPYRGGRKWQGSSIRNILINSKYIGDYIWNQTCRRLHQVCKPNLPEKWVLHPGAFPGIIDPKAFERVQQIMRSKMHRWSREELLLKLRDLKAQKGYISAKLIQRTKGMPSLATYHRRLGPFREVYNLIEHSTAIGLFNRAKRAQKTQALRDTLVSKVTGLFPDRFSVLRLPKKRRPILLLDAKLMISVLVCSRRKICGHSRGWVTYPASQEKNCITLMAFANRDATGFSRYYLLPRLRSKSTRVFLGSHNQRLLKTGFRLKRLADLLRAAEVFRTIETKCAQ